MIEVTSTGALLFAAHGHFFHSPSTVRIRIAVPRHALPMKRHFDSFAARWPADPELGGMGRKPQVAWRYGLLAIESAGGASGAPGGLVKRSKVTESADIMLSCMLKIMYVVIRFPRKIPHDAVTNPQVRVVVAISNDVQPSVQGRLCKINRF